MAINESVNSHTVSTMSAECSLSRRQLTVPALLGLKLIADMFPSFVVLDYLLMGLACVISIISFREMINIRLGIIDCLALILAVLITANAIGDSDGIVIAIKMGSAILLYFIGRATFRDVDSVLRFLWIAGIVVVIANTAAFITGAGFKIWGGGANTFSGTYFFKTDLANAMALVITLALFYGTRKAVRVSSIVLGSIFILLSNARAYYFILPCIYYVYWIKRKGSRFRTRYILAVFAIIVLMLFVIQLLGSTVFFQRMGFISLKFQSLEDLFNDSNSQGRNYIFAVQMERILSSPLLNQLFGNGYTGDMVIMNGATYGAHSLYVGTLFNLGLIGLVAIVAMLLCGLRVAMRSEQTNFAHFVIVLIGVFLVSGLSYDVFQYTANSWNAFYFLGCLLSLDIESKHSYSYC